MEEYSVYEYKLDLKELRKELDIAFEFGDLTTIKKIMEKKKSLDTKVLVSLYAKYNDKNDKKG